MHCRLWTEDPLSDISKDSIDISFIYSARLDISIDHTIIASILIPIFSNGRAEMIDYIPLRIPLLFISTNYHYTKLSIIFKSQYSELRHGSISFSVYNRDEIAKHPQ